MQCYGFSTMHHVSLQKTCTTRYALSNKCTKNQSKGNNLKEWQKCSIQSKENYLRTKQGRVMVLVHSPLSHCKKYAYQVWNYLNIWWQSYASDKKWSKILVHCTFQVISRNMHNKFEVIWSYGNKVVLQTRNSL